MINLGVQQEYLTQPWENLKVLTTKAIHKSYVKHVFEEPTTKLRLINRAGMGRARFISTLDLLLFFIFLCREA